MGTLSMCWMEDHRKEINLTMKGNFYREDLIVKNYRVMVVKYGYAVVEAETEKEALELIDDMQDKDFDWSDFDDGQVVEEVDY